MLARALFTSRSLCTKRLKPTRFTTTLAPFRSYTPSTPTMAPKAKKDEGSGRPLEMTPPPDYFATRNAIFDKRKAERDEWVAKQPRD